MRSEDKEAINAENPFVFSKVVCSTISFNNSLFKSSHIAEKIV